jgi:tRNA uracil 4-sulfurtransferase
VPEPIKKIYVRYDEVALKRGSRAHFEKKLKKNIARLAGLSNGQVKRIRGRCVVDIPDDVDGQECLKRISRCFGIAKLSPVTVTQTGLQTILQTAVELAAQQFALGAKTFKVEARRSYKKFPLKSPEINVEAGAVILEKVPGLTVDVHKPDFVVRIEVFAQQSYLYCREISGPGGLPTGVGGRAMLLLSGGIDSPVAGWLTQKRGLHIDAVYFHSFPFTGDKTKEKVKDLAAVLARSSPDPLRLHVCSATEAQKYIKESVPEAYWTLMLRRFMIRVTDRIAEKFNYGALVTGDALGQVASQTLDNLTCLEGLSKRLILRPLISFDKHEIIAIARKIGSYDLSILPYQDCCSLFAPAHPVIRGRRERCEKFDSEAGLDALVSESVAAMEVYKHFRKEGMVRVEKPEKCILEDNSGDLLCPENSSLNR